MKTKQQSQSADKSLQVDCTDCKRGVWLVKVPKYLSENWRGLAGQGEVGRLSVVTLGDARTGSTKDEVVFKSARNVGANNDATGEKGRLADAALGGGQISVREKLSHDLTASSPMPLSRASKAQPTTSSESGSLPEVHKFVIGNTSHLTLAVCSEDKAELDEDEEAGKSGRLCLEGRVVKRAECRPPISQNYMKMKISQIQDFSRPVRSIKQMDKAVIKFKPVSIHAEMVSKEKQKKEGKTVRMDKDRVMEMLFEAFEKHQYYKLTDLAKVTNQPPTYIKELLNEIGTYNTAPPHKYLWELKPEYRHYKGEPKQEDDNMITID